MCKADKNRTVHTQGQSAWPPPHPTPSLAKAPETPQGNYCAGYGREGAREGGVEITFIEYLFSTRHWSRYFSWVVYDYDDPEEDCLSQ